MTSSRKGIKRVKGVRRVKGVKRVERIDRLNDLAFKRVFGSSKAPEVTISFLNSVMGLEGEDAISQVSFTDREISPETLDDRGARLDVLVRTGTDDIINIEVQVANNYDIMERSLYYWARLYAAQLHSGEPFGVLRKTVTINILAFVLYPGNPKLHWKSVMRDEETGTPMGRVQELHFIEVPKFRAIGHQPCTPLEGWLAFLANQEGETMESIANRDPGLTAVDEDGLRAAATRDAQASLKAASVCESLEALSEWLRTL